MKPIYIPNYIDYDIFDHLMSLEWLEVTNARKEYFVSIKDIEYTYGSGQAARTYKSNKYTDEILKINDKLNKDFNCNYDVCFLNRYDNAKHALGWHSDSNDMNPTHDICVISFGAEREIWHKPKDMKGNIPAENKQLLGSGSLFIMPAGFQEINFHKIPKCDRECRTRISLTFRNYLP